MCKTAQLQYPEQAGQRKTGLILELQPVSPVDYEDSTIREGCALVHPQQNVYRCHQMSILTYTKITKCTNTVLYSDRVASRSVLSLFDQICWMDCNAMHDHLCCTELIAQIQSESLCKSPVNCQCGSRCIIILYYFNALIRFNMNSIK